MAKIVLFPQLNMHMLFHLLFDLEALVKDFEQLAHNPEDIGSYNNALRNLGRCCEWLRYALKVSQQVQDR